MNLKKISYNFLVILLLVIALAFFLSSLPQISYKFLKVQSGSMEPAVKMGSLILVTPAQDYEIGDIITFCQNKNCSKTITHRLVDIRYESGKAFYLTKGDVNKLADKQEIAEEQIVGKVRFGLPALGYVVNFVQKPIGFLIIILLPALLVIYQEIIKIKKQIKKNKKI